MNFLEKLNKLLLENNLNKKQLSDATGIPYTTIDSFYKKGYENIKLSTLSKLASFFDCPLDYLVDDKINDKKELKENIENRNNLSDLEKEILIKFSKLDDRDKKSIESIIDSLYQKKSISNKPIESPSDR